MPSACDEEPALGSDTTLCATVTSPEWIGDVGIIIEVETFSEALEDVEVAVYEQRTVDACPPVLGSTPMAAYLVTVPAGAVLTIDGAAEQATLYRKASKVTEDAIGFVTSMSHRLIVWPTVGGPCRSACVCVDPGGQETGDAQARVSMQARET
jgi:hypothetical protein